MLVMDDIFAACTVVLKVGVSYFLTAEFVSELFSRIWFCSCVDEDKPSNFLEQDQNIKMMSFGQKFEGGRFVLLSLRPWLISSGLVLQLERSGW